MAEVIFTPDYCAVNCTQHMAWVPGCVGPHAVWIRRRSAQRIYVLTTIHAMNINLAGIISTTLRREDSHHVKLIKDMVHAFLQ